MGMRGTWLEKSVLRSAVRNTRNPPSHVLMRNAFNGNDKDDKLESPSPNLTFHAHLLTQVGDPQDQIL